MLSRSLHHFNYGRIMQSQHALRYVSTEGTLSISNFQFQAVKFPSSFPLPLLGNHNNQQHHQQQQRWVHSQRQIKRSLNHPKRVREDAKMGIIRRPKPTETEQPQFQQIFEPTFLPNGWSAPPGPEVNIPKYPFHVSRTKNKPNGAKGFLPVYSTFRYVMFEHHTYYDVCFYLLTLLSICTEFLTPNTNKPNMYMSMYSKDGSNVTTRIKKVTGDRDLFLQELRIILKMPQPNNPNFDTIRIRTGGTIEVKGNRTRQVTKWLAGLGF